MSEWSAAHRHCDRLLSRYVKPEKRLAVDEIARIVNQCHQGCLRRQGERPGRLTVRVVDCRSQFPDDHRFYLRNDRLANRTVVSPTRRDEVETVGGDAEANVTGGVAVVSRVRGEVIHGTGRDGGETLL